MQRNVWQIVGWFQRSRIFFEKEQVKEYVLNI
jgi:hypothetical protein